MSCKNPILVYDLGLYNHCDIQELPLQISTPGIYTLKILIGAITHTYAFETNIPNQKISLDFSKLPIDREMILTVVNPVNNQYITFDLEVNDGTECDPIPVTKCFYIFKIKSNIFHHELS